jgi:hypothetical protein
MVIFIDKEMEGGLLIHSQGVFRSGYADPWNAPNFPPFDAASATRDAATLSGQAAGWR